jgi:hypothetical protein
MSSSLSLLLLSNIARAADYTGDGIDDLVVGVPFEYDIRGVSRAGGIHVIRGSSTGLTGVADAFLHQDSPGVVGSGEPNEEFGMGIAAGDVDGDGKDDLIVGAPAETLGSGHAGAIWRLELRATPALTTVARSEELSQRTTGIPGTPADADRFGEAIVAADFDGDGYDDVVVGAPHDAAGTVSDAGTVQYLRGSRTGLTITGQISYSQDSTNVEETASSSDVFGAALAAGDFDADGFADLAIGIPYEDWSGGNEGAVQVMYGTATGPGVVSPNDELWTAGAGGAAGTFQNDNNCGAALTVGDFDGDGYDDLAIGCPVYDIGGSSGAGAVLVVYGSASGLDDSEIWNQDTSGVIGGAETRDDFGRALTAGDYDGDGFADLAVSAPNEDYGSFTDNGVVHVLFGSASGVTSVDNLLLAPDTGSVVGGTPADFEKWGWAVTSGDYNADGLDDLVVSSIFDDEPGAYLAGAINVFYGSAVGPSTTDDEWFHQDSPGIAESCEDQDWFGFSLR